MLPKKFKRDVKVMRKGLGGSHYTTQNRLCGMVIPTSAKPANTGREAVVHVLIFDNRYS